MCVFNGKRILHEIFFVEYYTKKEKLKSCNTKNTKKTQRFTKKINL
jgi:hypothetical protein